jgi:hypothetical protein
MKLKHGKTYLITYSDLTKYPDLVGTYCICTGNWIVLLNKYNGDMIPLDVLGIIDVELEEVRLEYWEL